MTEIPAAGYFSEAARTNGEAKQAQDDVLAVLREVERAALAFAPHPSDPLAMTVEVKAGYLFVDGALTEVAAQTAGAFSAPAADPRIDRIVIDAVTGAVSVVQGAEAAAPVAPAIPNGKLPVARVALTVAMTEITGADITDERARAADSDPLTPTPSELTIAAGSVTPTAHYHTVDTESDAAADDLDTIATTNLAQGALLILAAEDAGRVVTLKDGVDNLNLAAGDYVLDSLQKRILLQRRGTDWDEVTRSGGLVDFRGPVAASGQSAIGWTDIPAWVNEIDVIFSGLSLNGTDHFLVQIGDSGGYETSGYNSERVAFASSYSPPVNVTSGIGIWGGIDTVSLRGILTFRRLGPGINTWPAAGTFSAGNNLARMSAGNKTLSGSLDRLQVTADGSDTFDAGNLSLILRE